MSGFSLGKKARSNNETIFPVLSTNINLEQKSEFQGDEKRNAVGEAEDGNKWYQIPETLILLYCKLYIKSFYNNRY